MTAGSGRGCEKPSSSVTPSSLCWGSAAAPEFNALCFILSAFSSMENGPVVAVKGHFSSASLLYLCVL